MPQLSGLVTDLLLGDSLMQPQFPMEVQPLLCLPVSAGAGWLLTSVHVPFWGSLLFIHGLGFTLLRQSECRRLLLGWQGAVLGEEGLVW